VFLSIEVIPVEISVSVQADFAKLPGDFINDGTGISFR
jgi:hypothetical protein